MTLFLVRIPNPPLTDPLRPPFSSMSLEEEALLFSVPPTPLELGWSTFGMMKIMAVATANASPPTVKNGRPNPPIL